MKLFTYSLFSLVVAGVLHTIERSSAVITKGIAVQGFAYNGVGFDMTPHYPAFYENIFTVLFLAISAILFLLGVNSLNKKKS